MQETPHPQVRALLYQGVDIVSAAQGSVPVLSLTHLSHPALIASMVANFLRAGCLAVQCVDEDESGRRSEKVLTILKVLARENESFVMEGAESIRDRGLDYDAMTISFVRKLK